MPAKPFKKKSVQKLQCKRNRNNKSYIEPVKTYESKRRKIKESHQESSSDESDRAQSPAKKLKTGKKNSIDRVRKLQLMEGNQEEDKTIKRMEKLLKLNKKKTKKLPSAFKDEGLSYLLDAIDRKEGHTVLSDGSDDLEDDLAFARGKPSSSKKDAKKTEVKPMQRPQPKQRTLTQLLLEKTGKVISDEEDDPKEGATCGDESGSSDEEETAGDSFDEDNDEDCDVLEADDDKATDNESDVSDDDVEMTDDIESSIQKRRAEPKVWEDIYGRMRDEKGNVLKNNAPSSNLYVPPKLRKENVVDQSKTEACLKIKRQLKGLLNRLSESNLQNICHQIEGMYMKNSRNDMNEAIFLLISELLFVSTLSPSRLIMEQAMLVALLHANVGPEVGAYFLQYIVKKLGDLFQIQNDYGDGKECNNVLIFLSHLYNFKVTHSTLIFNIFRILVDAFGNKDIELIQLLLKNVGFVMRKDDPLQLKELILAVQSKATESNKDQNDSRIRFMLETLTAIRNNNMYKIPDYDPSIVEHSKKFLRGLVRKGCSIQELNISYEDLLRAEERGRWWIVGSAWADVDNNSKDSKTVKEISTLPKTEISEKILQLAQKQHMNTEVRKSIFAIIMTAEDFMDAFEKLLKLNLRNQQEREIIHVILHCALQEKQFNPYYAYLAGKFCSFARKHQMCLQFSLWDKFKELSSMKSHQLNNLSRLLSHLFTSDALPLSVLKVIHFSEMDKTMVKFFRQILLSILLHDSEETCVRAFARIAASEKLKMLRESLRLFMHHFVLRNKSKLDPEEADRLQARVNIAEGALKAHKRLF